MKVLLISPSYYPAANASYFPLGLAYIAAYIKTEGHSVSGLNFNHMEQTEREVQLKEQIENNNFDIIGIGGLTVAFNEIDLIIKKIRQLDAKTPIVLGGGITSVEGQLMMETLKPDYAVVGEGELIFSELLSLLEEGKSPKKLQGIWTWIGSMPIYTGDGLTPKSLDALPQPDLAIFGIRDHLSLQSDSGQFSNHLTRLDVSKSLPLSASRSCPFKCTFCHHAGMGNYKKHDIVRVVDQIEFYINEYNCHSFSIYDELFSANKQRVIDFCSLLKERNLNIKWFCQLRMDQLDLPMLIMMRESGCHYISFGIESGSDVVLESMQKKITKKIIQDAVKLVREAKIGIQGNFLFGDPAESIETLEESLDFQEENKLYFCDWSAVIPYAGTPIYNYAVEKGLIENRENFMRSLCNIGGFLYNHQINMSKLTDEQYKDWYIKLREINDVNHRKQCAIIKKSHIISRWKSELTVDCPICTHEQSLVLNFPFQQDENGPVIKCAIGVEGLNIFCTDCGDKMHVKAKDIPHIKVIYQDFQGKVDTLKAAGKKIIVMPAMDRYSTIFLQDISIDPDMVQEVFDTRSFRENTVFLKKKAKVLNSNNVESFSGKTVVILPWVEFEEAYEKIILNSNNVNILSWNKMFI